MSTKTAQLLEGKMIAQKIQEEIRSQLAKLPASGKQIPKLISIETGQDSAGNWYIGQQEKLAQKLGILFERIKIAPSQTALQESVEKLNQDSAVHGIFIEMPLPKGMDANKILLAMNPLKDVEGIHPASLGLIVLRQSRLIPPTANSAFKLIESTGVELRGKKAVLVGQSAIVGRPLQMMLGEKRVTTVVCNSGTSEQDMQKFCQEADIVVGCAGQPGLIQGSWIKAGAIVIDVGTTEVNGKLVGDIEFESAKEKASFITPVPGGVGPLTVTMLMWNLMRAYEWQQADHS